MIWIHNTGWINKTAGSSLHSTICTVPLWHQFHFNYLSFPVSFLHFSAALYHSGRGGKLPYNYFCSFSLLSGLLIQNLLVFPIPKGFCGSPFLWFLVASVFEKHTNFSAEMALQPSFALLVILTPSWKQVDFPRLKMKKTKCQALKNSCGQCKYEKPTSYSKVLFWKSSSNYVFTVCWLLRQNSIEDATTTSWAVFWPIILKLLN